MLNKDVLLEIRDKVIRIEEHLSALNNRVTKNEDKLIDEDKKHEKINQNLIDIDNKVMYNNLRSDIKSGAIAFLTALSGAMGSYIFFKI